MQRFYIFMFLSTLLLVNGQFSGSTDDCNTVDRCPPVEVVFVIDTSASMKEEAQSICNIIDSVVENVTQTLSIDVSFDILGISRYGEYHGPNAGFYGAAFPCPGPSFYNATACDPSIPPELCPDLCWQNNVEERFRCLSGDVQQLYESKGLSSIPGNSSCVWPMPATCGYPGPSSNARGNIPGSCSGCYTLNGCVAEGDALTIGNQGETECWGAASTVVVRHYDWAPNSLRIVVPVSDEGPCNGGGSNDCTFDINDQWNFHGSPTCCSGPNDESDVDNLSAIAQEDDVIISAITAAAGTSATQCIDAYAARLANETGGFTGSTEGSADLDARMTEVISNIIIDACNRFVWSCEDGDPCTIRETCQFSTINATNTTNATETVDCIGICICENNCEDVSSFDVPEDDIDVGDGNDDDQTTTYIGAGVGAGVVATCLAVTLLAVVIAGVVILAVLIVVALVLQASGVAGTGATVVAQAFVDGAFDTNAMYESATTETFNPLHEAL